MTPRRAMVLILMVTAALIGFLLGGAVQSEPSTNATVIPPEIATPLAPEPIAPANGSSIVSSDVRLEWSAPLGENQFFAIKLWHEGDIPTGDFTWTVEQAISIADFLEDNPFGWFYWQVAIIQVTDAGFQGMVTGWSPVWSFQHIAPAPTPTPTIPEYETINPIHQQTNPRDLITIADAEDINEQREALIQYLWGTPELPSRLPDRVEESVPEEGFLALEGVDKVDEIQVRMDFGFESIIYLLHPQEPNHQLIVYHHGHTELYELDNIAYFTSRGYTVMAVHMPLRGPNNRPVIETPFGFFWFNKSHDQMRYLEPLMQQGSPLKLFLEPVAVALNYTDSLGIYERYHMVGLSGGGWTTTLYAAVDPRIAHSYPVAGTLPQYLRDGALGDWGDYEQDDLALYSIADYLDLYIMGASGEGRGQLQILNQYDECCFAGIRYTLYEDVVAEVVSGLGGGSFRVFLDNSHYQHIISAIALEEIARDLEGQ